MFMILNAALLSHHVLFFTYTATTEIYTLSLHDALPISFAAGTSGRSGRPDRAAADRLRAGRKHAGPDRGPVGVHDLLREARGHPVARGLGELCPAAHPREGPEGAGP